mmetsp:Transcript_76911/g.168114  ORF Transcript_76911/g.168114 Transcript_76911/m.168114 type:complete len:404 (+) Transcript_76911:355-1566(+)
MLRSSGSDEDLDRRGGALGLGHGLHVGAGGVLDALLDVVGKELASELLKGELHERGHHLAHGLVHPVIGGGVQFDVQGRQKDGDFGLGRLHDVDIEHGASDDGGRAVAVVVPEAGVGLLVGPEELGLEGEVLDVSMEGSAVESELLASHGGRRLDLGGVHSDANVADDGDLNDDGLVGGEGEVDEREVLERTLDECAGTLLVDLTHYVVQSLASDELDDLAHGRGHEISGFFDDLGDPSVLLGPEVHVELVELHVQHVVLLGLHIDADGEREAGVCSGAAVVGDVRPPALAVLPVQLLQRESQLLDLNGEGALVSDGSVAINDIDVVNGHVTQRDVDVADDWGINLGADIDIPNNRSPFGLLQGDREEAAEDRNFLRGSGAADEGEGRCDVSEHLRNRLDLAK